MPPLEAKSRTGSSDFSSNLVLTSFFIRSTGLKFFMISSCSVAALGLRCPKNAVGLAVLATEATLPMGDGLAALVDGAVGLKAGAVGLNSRARTLNLVETADVGVSVPLGLDKPETAVRG